MRTRMISGARIPRKYSNPTAFRVCPQIHRIFSEHHGYRQQRLHAVAFWSVHPCEARGTGSLDRVAQSACDRERPENSWHETDVASRRYGRWKSDRRVHVGTRHLQFDASRGSAWPVCNRGAHHSHAALQRLGPVANSSEKIRKFNVIGVAGATKPAVSALDILYAFML
jgi:hypothetical protein